MSKQRLWALIEAYRTSGGSEEHHARKELLDAALDKALAQPEQEPVALRHSFDGYGYLYTDMGFGSGWIEWTKRSHKDAEPLYTTPPQRTWVGLTDKEIGVLWFEANDQDNSMIKHFARAIEAKLKEKNTK